MFVIPNQSSVPKAYTQFTEEDVKDLVEGSSRMIASENRMRLVDCMEEFVKYTILIRPHFGLFSDRCSERETERKSRDGAVNGVEVGKIENTNA